MEDHSGAEHGVFSARDRFATSRILTALMFGAAAAGMAALHFALAPHPDLISTREVYIGAAIVAVIAGWRGVGTRLGHGVAGSGLAGLGSAVAAGGLFSIVAGVRSVIESYGYTHFRTVEALLLHAVEKSAQMGVALVQSPILCLALLAAICVALLGEAARFAWDRSVIEPT